MADTSILPTFCGQNSGARRLSCGAPIADWNGLETGMDAHVHVQNEPSSNTFKVAGNPAWCLGRESNPHEPFGSTDFKSLEDPDWTRVFKDYQ